MYRFCYLFAGVFSAAIIASALNASCAETPPSVYSQADVAVHVDPNTLNSQNADTQLPVSIKKVLKKQPRLKMCFYGGPYVEKSNMDNFFVVPASLKGNSEDGLVVAPGSIECGMGADINTFWVFVKHDGGYQPVLETFAYSLDVLKKEVNGYHLIGIVAHTAIVEWRVTYAFDGKSYQPDECSQRHFGPRRDSAGNFLPTPWKTIACGNSVKPYR